MSARGRRTVGACDPGASACDRGLLGASSGQAIGGPEPETPAQGWRAGAICAAVPVMNKWSYNFKLFGTPHPTEPWGWQIYGHHMIVNCMLVDGHITMTPSFAARWLLPRIGRFLEAYPDVDLDVRASLALVDFARDDADVAIRYGHGDWPNVHVEHLLDEVCFPVCSPRLAGGRLPIRPADLSRYTLLRSNDEFWKPWLEAAGLDPAYVEALATSYSSFFFHYEETPLLVVKSR